MLQKWFVDTDPGGRDSIQIRRLAIPDHVIVRPSINSHSVNTMNSLQDAGKCAFGFLLFGQVTAL